MATLTTSLLDAVQEPSQEAVQEAARSTGLRNLDEASSREPARLARDQEPGSGPGEAGPGRRLGAILDQMLQAQIEIVDEAGHTEESVTIVGSGRVSLGTSPEGGYLHADEAATDLAVIAHDGERVSIDVKVENALQRDSAFITRGSVDLASTQHPMVAFIEQARRYVRVKQVFVSGELLRGGAVIHSMPSSLVRRAQASAARGAIEVTQQLQRLRDQGKIDEHGNLLVPWPDDMKPDSPTDL